MWEDNVREYEQAPKGTHLARCIKIIDIGTQEGTYEGKPTSNRQSVVTWELPKKLMEDGRPFTISKFYNITFGDKSNLTKDLVNWLGDDPYTINKKTKKKSFDPTILLGKECQVTIVEREGSGKHAVNSVTSVPDGVEVPEPVNELFFFSLNKGEYDETKFDSIAKYFQEKIMASPEYAEIMNPSDEAEPEDKDDIPF